MESKKIQLRHIAKSISWRIIATIDTITIAYFITGNALLGFKLGFAEVVTKIFIYYLHERVWFRIRIEISKLRHILKAVSFRFFGTIDTIMLAWIISGNSAIGLKIGSIEVMTKIALYYLHERAWYQTRFGLEKKE